VLLLDGLDIKTAGANLPQSINYLPLSIGGALMAVFALNQMVQAAQAPVADAEGDR
jgi:TRAP-type C4-dicarboxylate transport system permease small subunit